MELPDKYSRPRRVSGAGCRSGDLGLRRRRPRLDPTPRATTAAAGRARAGAGPARRGAAAAADEVVVSLARVLPRRDHRNSGCSLLTTATSTAYSSPSASGAPMVRRRPRKPRSTVSVSTRRSIRVDSIPAASRRLASARRLIVGRISLSVALALRGVAIPVHGWVLRAAGFGQRRHRVRGRVVAIVGHISRQRLPRTPIQRDGKQTTGSVTPLVEDDLREQRQLDAGPFPGEGFQSITPAWPIQTSVDTICAFMTSLTRAVRTTP